MERFVALMYSIILTTDFSPGASNAIRYALELLKYERVQITLLHAEASSEAEFSQNDIPQSDDKHSDSEVAKLKKCLQEVYQQSPNPQHRFKAVCTSKGLLDAINDFVHDSPIDMVVMGTRGEASNASGLGSQTLQAIKFLPVPVLAVPENYGNLQPERILFPTDYNFPFKKWELKLLSTLARRFVCQITFLNVTKIADLKPRQKENKGMLEDYFRDVRTNFENASGLNLLDVINKKRKEHVIDLLVMANHRHSFMEELLDQGVISQLSLTTEIPFLVLQNLERRTT